MGRWEPGARERLAASALALFAEQGFERTTVGDIAAAAGVTERTFYRHFGDKREVLFLGSEDFGRMFTRGLDDLSAGVFPVVERVVIGLGEFFADDRREWSRRRQVVIDADPELQEREQLKLVGTASALAAALVERGVAAPRADLVAQLAFGVFRTTFVRWVAAGEERSFAALAEAAFAEARAELAG